jgi:hypothetical protein
MATNFPTSVDVLTNPVSNDSLNSPSHSAQHANANDAIEAIENAIIAPVTYPDQLVNGTTATVRPLPFATNAGSASITGNGTITFAASRFTQTPLITANVQSTANTGTSVTYAGATTSSVTVYVWSGSTASTVARTVTFFAVQMTSAASAG